MPFTKAGRELQPFVQCGERHHSFSPLLFENESDPTTGNEPTVNGKHSERSACLAGQETTKFGNLTANKFESRAELERFSQLLQETEHFCPWRQEKVAKIVPYAPPLIFIHSQRPSLQRPDVCLVHLCGASPSSSKPIN